MSLDNPITALYKEIDGSKITTDLYLPPSTATSPQKYPVGGSLSNSFFFPMRYGDLTHIFYICNDIYHITTHVN